MADKDAIAKVAFLFMIGGIVTILEKLMGGVARVRATRFFLENPDQVVTSQELAKLSAISIVSARREIRFLRLIELIAPAKRVDEIITRKKTRKKKISGFRFVPTFPLTGPLRNLLIGASPVSREKIVRYFKNRNGVQLVVVGGAFVNVALSSEDAIPLSEYLELEHAIDLLIVGQRTKRGACEPLIKKLEAEMGRELAWALLTPAEFEHRMAMHDKFLRDLFDYPHEILINKLWVK